MWALLNEGSMINSIMGSDFDALLGKIILDTSQTDTWTIVTTFAVF
ncbi:MAG: hypothetical protein ACJA13_000248 [Paraglaciecola sp.]|jgi:hypothetical protein